MSFNNFGSQKKDPLLVGVDVGSTTVKAVVLHPGNFRILHSRYERHNADQTAMVRDFLEEIHALFSGNDFLVTFCGSAGRTYADAIGTLFVQEVVANALAVKTFHPEARSAIELGGQDAKVIFFEYDEKRKQLSASDMRMNGSCAGGTGAFLDQIAELLHFPSDEFNAYAARGNTVHEISGRCGVFAKTDIAPLLNQGIDREDIALSSLHALAKQTIGGLAQGMTFHPKVIFEGGPLTFNPTLIRVFIERLGLEEDEVILPERPEILVACGAALGPGNIHAEGTEPYQPQKALSILENLDSASASPSGDDWENRPFFSDEDERRAFFARHALPDKADFLPESGRLYPVWIGVDAGSTTAKFVVIDENDAILHTFYAPNRGDPLDVVNTGLIALRDKWLKAGAALDVRGLGTTGYGENLLGTAYKADFHCVETVAHARAARKFVPEVSFILDIGGQDMKAISLTNGVVNGIILNEACSAGCGSFLETYARSLGIAVDEIAQTAFNAAQPSHLGSRCTVFMNSTIITEQKNGRTTADIIAGICRSIVENVFTKVVRVRNHQMLGDAVVVQGGTFKNDAVLRALEQYLDRPVYRAPYSGEMGALGVALLTRERQESDVPSRFIGLDALENFTYQKKPGQTCPFCANECSRTVVTFPDGSSFVTGNRCERGEVLGDPKDAGVKQRLKKSRDRMERVPDLITSQGRLIFAPPSHAPLEKPRGIRIGIPRTLEFWSSAPFWSTLFHVLGFEVVFSDPSTYRLFDKALPFVPSDTVCFPAKLAHGHVESLLTKGVDRIFFPQMIQTPRENPTAEKGFNCAIVQAYSLVVSENNEVAERTGHHIDRPIFHWGNDALKRKQLIAYLRERWNIAPGLAGRAYELACAASDAQSDFCMEQGRKILDGLGKDEFAVVVACRPYHLDPLVNHGLSRHFVRLGIPVITLDALLLSREWDLRSTRTDTVIKTNNRILEAAMTVAADPRLELVQIVSFGCGHDAVLTDEIIRLMTEISNKEPLVLKLDEGDAAGPVGIRVKSFVETVRERRQGEESGKSDRKKVVPDVFPVKFTAKDRRERTIYIPNLSPAFTKCLSAAVAASGYRVESLPLANKRAVALGKKYVHNDICFPAQVNIGEFLTGLENGHVDPQRGAMGIGKSCESCRALQYPALARKALDDAGYADIPIVTTGKDNKGMHPGFSYSPAMQLNTLWGLTIIDGMERMRRRIRPYETHPGSADTVFNQYLNKLCANLSQRRRKILAVLDAAIEAFNAIEIVETPRRPRVGVVGEIMMNYHPSANGSIESYLEAHGMEVVLPDMHDFFRKGQLVTRETAKKGWTTKPFLDFLASDAIGRFFDAIASRVSKRMDAFAYDTLSGDVHQMFNNVRGKIDVTYRTGESWKIPGEIIQMAKEGVHSFVIVQPFGCLPNHITGRGMIKTLKKLLPHVQILSLDYDPDISMANIENRLQMLIINALEKENIGNGSNSAHPPVVNINAT